LQRCSVAEILPQSLNWEDSEVARDRNWVSSRQPDDLPVFNGDDFAVL